ncbi:MAG: hypothetical protein WCG20_01610 [bacterium]
MANVRDMGLGQWNEFSVALHKAGFDTDLIQKIINARDNKLAKAMYTAVIGEELDERFGPAIVEFELTVPTDYNHDTQIDTSGAKARKEKTTYYYNDDLTSKNFAKATNKLVPGKTYKVKIFPILSTVTSEDCMALLRKQKAILVGGQGATLVYDLAKDKLPKGKWTASFDEKDALWKDADGDRRVPYVHAFTDGGFKFNLGNFGLVWHSVNCVLCFCELI